MPELPEVEITVRLLRPEVVGQKIEAATAKGINTIKTVEPPLDSIVGREIIEIRRRGKMIVVDFEKDLSLLIHLMSAGRLQLSDGPVNPKDRAERVALVLSDDRQLRLREFGTRQLAWAKILATDAVESDPSVSSLGPEAWPEPPQLETLPDRSHRLSSWLRDQRVIAGIGRAWCDEILFDARLSPFKSADRLTDDESKRLRNSIASVLDRALADYEANVEIPIPAKLKKPLLVHGREGEPCTRCGRTLEAVHYSKYVLVYCPDCQNDGKTYKDRRMSKLLK